MVFGIFGLEFLKKNSPSWSGWGGKNRVLVYSILGSFIKVLDIDEFDKILGHCAYGNDKRFLLLII
jgi:hypothetical protein